MMKVYRYEFPSDFIHIVVFFEKKRVCKFLNRLFLPQLPHTTNWFRRLFKSTEVTFLTMDMEASLIGVLWSLANMNATDAMLRKYDV